AAVKADTERVRKIDARFDYLPDADADIALWFGKANRGLELYEEARERNPLDPNILNALGVALCAANRLQECLQTRLSLLQLHPEFGGVNRSVGTARLFLNQPGEALEAMQREPNEDYRLGRRSESNAALQSLTDGFASIDAYGIAVAHAYRGDSDQAFRWLERAYLAHDYGMLSIKTDP